MFHFHKYDIVFSLLFGYSEITIIFASKLKTSLLTLK